MLKSAFSLKPKEKYERIGQADAKKIVRLVSNYSARTSMKPVVTSMGTNKVSVINFLKKFKKPTDVDKVVKAVQKHFNKGIDPKIQKIYMKANMKRDELNPEDKIKRNLRLARANQSSEEEFSRLDEHGRVKRENFSSQMGVKAVSANASVGRGVISSRGQAAGLSAKPPQIGISAGEGLAGVNYKK